MTVVCTASVPAVICNYSHAFCGFPAKGKGLHFLSCSSCSINGHQSRLQPAVTGGVSLLSAHTHSGGGSEVLMQAGWSME